MRLCPLWGMTVEKMQSFILQQIRDTKKNYFRLYDPYTLPQDLADEAEKPFYESEKDEEDEEDETEGGQPKPKPYMMDSDHRLLLRQCKPLLNSRNAAVSI